MRNREEIEAEIKTLEGFIAHKKQQLRGLKEEGKPEEWKLDGMHDAGVGVVPETRLIEYDLGDSFSRALAEYLAETLNMFQQPGASEMPLKEGARRLFVELGRFNGRKAEDAD